ncbi:hypothetical protein T02_171 [Trichinella nativa]|uniref:Uncharacterized protein n=1 Tax=Trichinella nativa TaxID=6335 RepID=A0A0V1LD55_9BILA|nr:hypothetical protein T02_171 [Trichinella nativa]
MKECGLPEAEPLAGRTINHLVPPPHPLRTSPESRCVDDGHPVTTNYSERGGQSEADGQNYTCTSHWFLCRPVHHRACGKSVAHVAAVPLS